MRPVLFHIGVTPVWSHSFFVTLGAVTALALAWRVATRRRRAQQELLWIIAGGLVGGALFARFGLVFRYLQEAPTPTLSGFARFGGLTLLGGLTGAYLGVLLTKRLIGYRRHTGDILVPGVALGIAIGRIGCLLAERPGTATTLPWGVRVAPDLAANLKYCEACATGQAMHASFLYESLFLTLAAAWLYPLASRGVLPARWMTEGDLFKLFLLGYAVFRFGVEFVRGNPVMAFGLSGSQLMVVPAAVALLGYFVLRRRNSHVATAIATAT